MHDFVQRRSRVSQQNLRDGELARTTYWGKAVVRKRTSTLLLFFNPFGKHVSLMGNSMDSSEHIARSDEIPVNKGAEKYAYEKFLRASDDIFGVGGVKGRSTPGWP
jgi:hypothetical protein